MEDKGYVQDRSQFSPSELLGFLNEWVKDNLTKSTQNCNTYFYAHWCNTQLRKACSKVKILVRQVQAIPVLEIGAIKRNRKNLKLIKTTITQHHSSRTLTTRPRYGIRPNCIKPRSASGATSDIRELTSFGSKTFCLT